MNKLSVSSYMSLTIFIYIYVLGWYVFFPVNKYLLKAYTVIFFLFTFIVLLCSFLIFWEHEMDFLEQKFNS